MELKYSNDGFWPYESFDYIYGNRTLPEFGQVSSPYCKVLTTWKFFCAKNESEIPFGFEGPSFDDTDWDIQNVPSTWQTEGYGLPQNLLYDYPALLEKGKNSKEESLNDKLLLHSTSSENDAVGIYRTSLIFEPSDIDRAIYLEISGICGSFEIYLNGKLQIESHSVYTCKKILLSGAAMLGMNTLVILVNRFDRDKHGHVIKEFANFGFSGIFRPLYICEESLLEMSNLHLSASSVPAGYINQLVVKDDESSDGKIAKISRGNYILKADLNITNHTDYLMPYSIRTTIVEAKAEYDPYNLPIVKTIQDKPSFGTVDAHGSVVVAFEMTVPEVNQWSDATPVQYDAVFELLDSEGRVICAKKKRFAFRTTEVMLDKININERRIPLMMVKYYEFDPFGGLSIPIDKMRQDIILMKRCGINGVVCQAFPLNETFLNLCDQYGIYVFAIADSRLMFDYVESSMIHPSIIAWGFPDSSFDAEKCITVKNQCELVDSTRPWYCEVDFDSKVSDIKPFPNDGGVVFGPWQDLCLDRENIFSKNKTGRNIFYSIPGRMHFDDDDENYKWIHHADLVGGKQREDSSIGQGIVDALRNPHPIYFDIKKQCQTISIFQSNDNQSQFVLRNIHPFAYTDELVLEWKILLGGKVLLNGSGLITEIEPYGTRTLKFPVKIDMYTVPGWANGNIKTIEIYMSALSHELVLDISLRLSKDSYYAKEGYELAFYQEVLTTKVANPVAINSVAPAISAISKNALPQGEVSMKEVLPIENESESVEENSVETTEEVEPILESQLIAESIDESDVSDELVLETNADELTQRVVYGMPQGIAVERGNVKLVFDRSTGSLNHVNIEGFDFLKGGMVPSFYRCPSNIDRTDNRFLLAKTIFSKETDYEAIQDSIKFVGCNYGDKDGVFTFISRYKAKSFKNEIIVCYTFDQHGVLTATLDFTPTCDLIRYGFRVPIVKNDIRCEWYGRGPGESYYDRKNATRLGVFSAYADKIYHPYARPAENSSHCDTETVLLSNKMGDAIEVRRQTVSSEGNNRFEFTVLPYSPEQMNEYLHEEQLKQNEYCEFFMDFCSKEIERTKLNISSRALRKNMHYSESMVFKFRNDVK